jgi:uncharacterized repeat protein (TIGR03803 family)
MTHFGGTTNADAGVVFKINTDGTGFTDLHVFTNSDGRGPANAKLTLSDNTLYGTTFEGGTTYSGGSYGARTVFKLQTDGSGFFTLHNFDTNGGPAAPATGVVLDGNTLYGTSLAGGSGTVVFSLAADGTRFAILHNFTNSDGTGIQGDLLLSGNRLYGATIGGGAGYGTIFSVSTPPQLSIATTGNNLLLSWPTNAPGFSVQTSTNLSLPQPWSTLGQQPIVVNCHNTVIITNCGGFNGQCTYFRLTY